MKTTPRPLLSLSLASSLLLAACGGGAAATGGPGSGPTGGAIPSAGPTAASALTQPPAGSVTPAPGQGAAIDACKVLSAADIKAITDHEVATSVPGNNFGTEGDGCQWDLKDAGAMIPPSVTLELKSPGGRDYWDRYFKPFITAENNKPIDGVGDEAFTGFGNVATVVVGDAFFEVQYIGSSNDPDGLEVDIARRVAENLAQ